LEIKWRLSLEMWHPFQEHYCSTPFEIIDREALSLSVYGAAIQR
jgi:hypothetical protein